MSIAEVKLTPSSGGYLFSKGKYLNNNGKPAYKQFRLPKNHEIAKKIAQALLMVWEQMTATDPSYLWQPEDIARAFAFAAPNTSNVPAPSQSAPTKEKIAEKPVPTPTKPGLTLYQGFAKHEEELALRYKANEIGLPHYKSCLCRIKGIKAHIKDVPLRLCDNRQLLEFRRIITSRPLSNAYRAKGDTTPPEPISLSTVENWLIMLGMSFDFFTGSEVGWNPENGKWRDAFSLSRKAKFTMLKADGGKKKKPSFTLDDLTTIYGRAVRYDRMLMLLGLTCGWTQTEISTMTKDEFVQKKGEWFIIRDRNKTGVPGYWWVCPELAELLKDEIARTPENKGNFALLTDEGNELVRPFVHDSIAQRWRRHLKKVKEPGVTKLSFKWLRKYASQMILNLGGGNYMVDVMLAHAGPNTLNADSYVDRDMAIGIGETDFERFHKYQRRIHEHLKPMFDAAKKSVGTPAPQQTELAA